MAIKSDSQGFLVGNPIDLIDLRTELNKIGDDTKAMRLMLGRIAGFLLKTSAAVPSSTPSVVVKEPKAGAAKSTPIDVHVTVDVAEPKAKQKGSDKAKATAGERSKPKAAQKPGVQPVTVVGAPKTVQPHVREKEVAQPVKQQAVGDALVQAAKKGAQEIEIIRERKSRKRTAGDPAAVVGAKRDAKGRFIKGANGAGEAESAGSIKALEGAASKLSEVVKEAGEGVGEADPAVQAIQEIAQPISSGLRILGFGQESGEEGWLKKIFRSLRDFRKEESTFNRAQGKTLKEIAKKKPGIVQTVKEKGAGMLAGAKALGSSALGMFGTFAKRIPLIGAAIAGMSSIFDIFSSESSEHLTRTEKDKATGKAAGKGVGAIGGMLAGAKLGGALGAIAGPIGSAIGATVGGAAGVFFGTQAGSIVGEKLGGFVSYLREVDIPGKISGAWDGLTTSLKSGWEAALQGVSAVWDQTTQGFAVAWERTTQGLASAWEQAAQGVAAVWDKAVQGFSSVWDKAVSGLSSVWDKTKETVGGAVDTANTWVKEKIGVDVASSVKGAMDSVKGFFSKKGGGVLDTIQRDAPQKAPTVQPASKPGVESTAPTQQAGQKGGKKSWQLGSTSAIFESGLRGAGAISSGKGDFGGASYGKYQFSSTQGTVQKFIQDAGYSEKFKGLKPGSKQFNAVWRDLAKNDPSFETSQHDFVKKQYYDKASEGLKARGLDMSNRGRAVQDAIWSTSVQFGAGGATNMMEKALKGKDVSSMSDADIVTALQDYKIENNHKLFKSSSTAIQRGTLNRAQKEKARLLALANEDAKPSTVETAREGAQGISTQATERESTKETDTSTNTSATSSTSTVFRSSALQLAREGAQGTSTQATERESTKETDTSTNTSATSSTATVFRSGALQLAREGAQGTSVENVHMKAAIARQTILPSQTRSVTISGSNATSSSAWDFGQKTNVYKNLQVMQSGDIPRIERPIGTSAAKTPTVVNVQGEVGQDVKDRAIAHIVSGGVAW